jgi:hypothetical protein
MAARDSAAASAMRETDTGIYLNIAPGEGA